MSERTSEPARIGAVIDAQDHGHAGASRPAWPPEHPGPGIEFRRIPTGQSSYARKEQHRMSMLVPVITDLLAFYRNCPGSRLRPTPEGACQACKGGRFLAVVRRSSGGGVVATGQSRGCPVCGGSGSDAVPAGGRDGRAQTYAGAETGL